MTDTGKTSWPELTGLDVVEAEQVVRRERPDLNIAVCGPGTFLTADYRKDRLVLRYDPETRCVTDVPSVG
ncbi:serine protease inhibitor [Streptacidiphilus jiangxiensis]|uniref:Potato inhibitor I family protein n=1 Tax=Streptacidiphilus jiangxiensis TaxID=235985 RepID=A0A1H7V2J3_STRJI|nr:serine protease inhibitor [Streptacidiphilus jiangxiensis]SEM03432.1 Potato inhibitor I family protein [Streptacidiphilus jiangxiensis]